MGQLRGIVSTTNHIIIMDDFCALKKVLLLYIAADLFLCLYVVKQSLNHFKGAGCSSVDSVPAFEAVGRRIDPSQWTQPQFGLFSVPTSGPQLVYQRPWYVLFCLWKSAYKRSLGAYRKE